MVKTAFAQTDKKENIVERYKWLIDKLKKEFPTYELLLQTGNCGFDLGIGFKNGEKRTAFLVEYVKLEQIYNEEEQEYIFTGKILEYDNLNLSPIKEDKVKNMIKRFHEVLDK